MDNCFFELKTNITYYTSGLLAATMGFNFWQRQYVPRKFYVFSIFSSMMAGTMLGCVKTSWYYVEQMDKLGQEYELSRVMKQDIFDTRSDMNSAQRAQYYQHQQKLRDQ